MAFDLTNLSSKDLDALISVAKQRKVALKKRKSIAAVREKLAKAAKVEGYTLDELFAGATANAPVRKRASKKKITAKRAAKRAAKSTAAAPAKRRGRPASPRAGSKVPAKYRNPSNPSEVWSGRGMTPRWMAAYLRQGKTRDDFLI